MASTGGLCYADDIARTDGIGCPGPARKSRKRRHRAKLSGTSVTSLPPQEHHLRGRPGSGGPRCPASPRPRPVRKQASRDLRTPHHTATRGAGTSLRRARRRGPLLSRRATDRFTAPSPDAESSDLRSPEEGSAPGGPREAPSPTASRWWLPWVTGAGRLRRAAGPVSQRQAL